MRELYQWILPKLGTREPLPPASALSQLPSIRYPRFSRYRGVLRSIWTSSSWSQQRSKTRAAYIEKAEAVLQAGMAGQSPAQIRQALGPIMSFAYPPMWQWLRDR